MKAIVSAMIVLTCVSAGAAQTVLYVDDDSVGGDGSSWQQALGTLDAALAAAAGATPAEIRVAAGTYVPDATGLVDTREATFTLIDDVTVRGGFAGLTGFFPDEQDPDDYETILSGDLNGDDGPNFANNTENCYHVVTGSNTTASARLEAFTITGGNATGNASRQDGGGLYIFDGSPTVLHCRFIANAALSRGGGVHITTHSNPKVINCLFANNVAVDGGGLWNGFDSKPMITNCTLTANLATATGGGIHNRSVSSTPLITNTILWGNLDAGGMDSSGQLHVFSGAPVVNYCCIQGGWTGAGGSGIVAIDPAFADSDYRLGATSPCIDAGDNAAVMMTTDLGGRPRRTDHLASPDVGSGTAPMVDIGAHEFGFSFDGDGDGDIDGADFVTFLGCFNGSNQPRRPACQNKETDFDDDGDVDLFDFLRFSNCFNGDGNPPKCP